MSVKIRLRKDGRKHNLSYSIIISDSRSPRNGKYIEKIGYFSPKLLKNNNKNIYLSLDKIKFWISRGAKPTKPVLQLLNVLSFFKKTN